MSLLSVPDDPPSRLDRLFALNRSLLNRILPGRWCLLHQLRRLENNRRDGARRNIHHHIPVTLPARDLGLLTLPRLVRRPSPHRPAGGRGPHADGDVAGAALGYEHDGEGPVGVLEGGDAHAGGVAGGANADGAGADEAGPVGEGPEAGGDFVGAGGFVDADDFFLGEEGGV